MVTLNILGVYFDEQVADQIRDAVGRVESAELTLRNVSRARPLKSDDLDPIPDVVIFEIDGQNVQDINDIERLMQTHREDMVVFVTYKEGDVPTMRRLMRAGVRDVFEQPIRAQEMVLALTGVLSEKRGRLEKARGGRGGITAFMDAKGGSGGTTLAVNVAHMLVSQHNARVAFVDLDLQFGSGALSLDINPHDNGLRALRDPKRVDDVFLQALMSHHESGLDVLASPVTVVQPEGVSKEGVSRLLNVAAEAYDFVIVDLPRGLTDWEQMALTMADPVVLVMQNNLASIRDIKLLLDRLPSMGVPLNRVEVVINRAESKAEHVTDSQLGKMLEGMSVHQVRNDYDTAATAQDEGAPVANVGKRSAITKDVAALAKYLFTLHKGESGKKTGVFGHWFGHH